MKKYGITAAVCALTLCATFTSCKPTEKNYREAYDTAQRARQAERQADADLGIPALTSLDAPRRTIVGSDSVPVRREALTLHGQAPKSGFQPYNVAVGKYKMTANAEGDAESLRSAGYDAFVLATPRGEFYTILCSAPTLAEAARMLSVFKAKHPGRPYVGLPGEPVIEIPLAR